MTTKLSIRIGYTRSLMSDLCLEWAVLPGLVEYNNALELMQVRVADILNNKKGEAVFLVEHPDIYTAGTSYKEEELINNIDIPVVYTGRGGKFTYHGPGQRVIYPILNLAGNNRSRDLRLYITLLEQLIINTLKKIDVNAYTIKDKVGIWVDIDSRQSYVFSNPSSSSTFWSTDSNKIPAKIGAIGVRIKKWVTYHGAAININSDLTKFRNIIPCGIKDLPVTSLEDIGVNITMSHFDSILQKEFNKLFL